MPPGALYTGPFIAFCLFCILNIWFIPLLLLKPAESKKESTSREAFHLQVPLDPKMGSEVEYTQSLEPIPESSTQTEKEVGRPEDVVARKIQGLDDDNEEPQGVHKSVLEMGDHNSVGTATAKEVKKRKADGDTPEQAPEKEEKKKKIKTKDEKTAGKNDNLSKTRATSDGPPESLSHHTAPQKSDSVADGSINTIPRAESDNESRLENNEEVTHLPHLDIHKEAKAK